MCRHKAINKVIIKYMDPIPILEDVVDELHRLITFSKIDLRSDYNQIRIYEGDE